MRSVSFHFERYAIWRQKQDFYQALRDLALKTINDPRFNVSKCKYELLEDLALDRVGYKRGLLAGETAFINIKQRELHVHPVDRSDPGCLACFLREWPQLTHDQKYYDSSTDILLRRAGHLQVFLDKLMAAAEDEVWHDRYATRKFYMVERRRL
jgi:hypothetical protein